MDNFSITNPIILLSAAALASWYFYSKREKSSPKQTSILANAKSDIELEKPNISSYRAHYEIHPKWQRIWEHFAEKDGAQNSERVLEILRELQKSGYAPQQEKAFNGFYTRTKYVDLISGLTLFFNADGRVVHEKSCESGWIVYDNDSEKPFKHDKIPSIGSFFKIDNEEFEIYFDNGLFQEKKQDLLLHYNIYDFEKMLVCLEADCPGLSWHPIITLPSSILRQFSSFGFKYGNDAPGFDHEINYVADNIENLQELFPNDHYPYKSDGLKLGINTNTFFAHKLESEWLEIYMSVEGFSSKLGMLKSHFIVT